MADPTYENADTFVDHLTRAGILAFDPLIEDVLCGRTPDLPAALEELLNRPTRQRRSAPWMRCSKCTSSVSARKIQLG
ncbi:MAG: hypothetical protein GYB64_15375 [Chloroflexi bacterium]|nr:hypothetical protein [Chloroflexota bacterium]